ncbi:MAG TPA: serine/threonine-protein kinase PknK, partial [Myxococcaceae bacterium]
ELLLNGAGVDEAAGMEAIEALRLRQVLEDTGTGRLRFVHDKLRETTYAELTAAQLLALHRRAAEAIERRGPVPPGQYGVLAQHWARAQEHAQAGGWFTRAGEQARATYANDEAIGLFRAALQEFRALPPAEATRALQQLHESLGELLAHTGRQEEARESLGAALALLPEHERLQRARLHRKLGKTWEAHHRYDEALSLYGVADSCLGAPPAEGSASAWWQEWVQLQFERVSVSYFSARMDEGNALIERLRPVVEAQGTTLQRVHLFRTLIQSGLRKDRYLTSAQTVGYARACLAESEKTGEVGDIFNTRFALGFVLLNTSEQSAVLEAEELLLETLRGAERFGDLMLQARCLAYLTLLYRRLNRAEETRRFAERCKPIAASGQFSDYLGLVRACLAWSCWREQRLTEAEQEARAALELWRPLALVYPFQWTALLPLAAIELQRGQLEDAVARVHAALEPRQQLLPEDLTGSLERVRTSWRDGQHGAAGEHLLRALELARARGYL